MDSPAALPSPYPCLFADTFKALAEPRPGLRSGDRHSRQRGAAGDRVFAEFTDLDLADARYQRQVIIGVALDVATFLPAAHITKWFWFWVNVDGLLHLDRLFEAALTRR